MPNIIQTLSINDDRIQGENVMISRHWRGLVKPDRAADYEEHLQTETIPSASQITGFLGADIFKRALENGIEFVVISRWASADAIAMFAGADVEAAVIPVEIESMMIDYDRRARHYECIEFRSQ
ncbi:MAG: antibiotic biosynthesis monooxygenase [Usitatibacteraceae bacterium]